MLETIFNPETVNPNAIYLLFVAGLWVGITAIYIPGTGLAEIVGLVLLGASVAAFVILPTNWLAVALITFGLSFFLILPFLFPEWAKYAEAGLLLQGIGGFFLLDGLPISPLLILITLGVAVIYHRFALLPIMRTQRQPIENDLSVVGMTGRVIREIDPLGTVQVNGELWTARGDGYLARDTEILVVDQHGLELEVEKAKRE